MEILVKRYPGLIALQWAATSLVVIASDIESFAHTYYPRIKPIFACDYQLQRPVNTFFYTLVLTENKIVLAL